MKAYNRKTTAFVLLLVVICSMACSKDGTLEGPDLINPLEEPDQQDPLEGPEGNLQGSLEEVENYYTVEFVEALEEINVNINLGNTPPNLEGSYLISPFILETSTVESDSTFIGGQFEDYLVTFSNQNNENLTIDLAGAQTSQNDEGSGSFITGSNVSFTVFTKTTSQQGSFPAETAIVISGVLSPNGILDVQFFGAMLDDNGDPEDVYIENNTGRLLVDGDDFSPKQTAASKTMPLNLPGWVKKID